MLHNGNGVTLDESHYCRVADEGDHKQPPSPTQKHTHKSRNAETDQTESHCERGSGSDGQETKRAAGDRGTDSEIGNDWCDEMGRTSVSRDGDGREVRGNGEGSQPYKQDEERTPRGSVDKQMHVIDKLHISGLDHIDTLLGIVSTKTQQVETLMRRHSVLWSYAGRTEEPEIECVSKCDDHVRLRGEDVTYMASAPGEDHTIEIQRTFAAEEKCAHREETGCNEGISSRQLQIPIPHSEKFHGNGGQQESRIERDECSGESGERKQLCELERRGNMGNVGDKMHDSSSEEWDVLNVQEHVDNRGELPRCSLRKDCTDDVNGYIEKQNMICNTNVSSVDFKGLSVAKQVGDSLETTSKQIEVSRDTMCVAGAEWRPTLKLVTSARNGSATGRTNRGPMSSQRSRSWAPASYSPQGKTRSQTPALRWRPKIEDGEPVTGKTYLQALTSKSSDTTDIVKPWLQRGRTRSSSRRRKDLVPVKTKYQKMTAEELIKKEPGWMRPEKRESKGAQQNGQKSQKINDGEDIDDQEKSKQSSNQEHEDQEEAMIHTKLEKQEERIAQQNNGDSQKHDAQEEKEERITQQSNSESQEHDSQEDQEERITQQSTHESRNHDAQEEKIGQQSNQEREVLGKSGRGTNGQESQNDSGQQTLNGANQNNNRTDKIVKVNKLAAICEEPDENNDSDEEKTEEDEHKNEECR